MAKFISTVLMFGAAWFMYQLVSDEEVVDVIRFGAFFYLTFFVFAGLWVWKKK